MSSLDDLKDRCVASFRGRFGTPPDALGVAPARVELLGNHTDYNGGLVMAAAIDRFTIAAGRPISSGSSRVHAVNYSDDIEFLLKDIRRGEDGDWHNYVKGVIWAIQDAEGPQLASGFEMAVLGDVPLGAGLSSSASLEAAVGFFLLQAGLVRGRDGRPIDPRLDDAFRMAFAKILRRSENAFVGVASGLLDQFSSLFGKADHAVYLDCRTLDHARVPLGDPGPAIVVCDSKTSRRLADGMYNRRRAECETVVTYFQAKGAESVTSLRDITLGQLEEHWDRLDPSGRRRARHILTENDRVRRGVEALRAGELEEFGRLMSASHASSRDDFENSSPALNALVEAAEAAPGFLGGKLSGAGWAGCTVNLVRADLAGPFAESVRSAYSQATGVTPDIHVCHAAEGARGMSVSG
ncbi:Galactokinase [Aquisphaera giovannonii]|uniref:Galactokinase n=1 Tax=Aquisphaera giovannonii TaxID=406548 RepID=A0A5B9VYX4_9BACT|nr:galactokinase [Aquisphaera giovannonii]QEH33184.1 Galactokinase [Aquisphaera giovannonii]